MPKWAKIAVTGALIAVLVDYFAKPTLGKTL
jgi:hypothetical protein